MYHPTWQTEYHAQHGTSNPTTPPLEGAYTIKEDATEWQSFVANIIPELERKYTYDLQGEEMLHITVEESDKEDEGQEDNYMCREHHSQSQPVTPKSPTHLSQEEMAEHTAPLPE